jgi:hypothetical protein
MTVRSTGEPVFIEFGSLRVRQIDASGRLSTLAGIGPGLLGENGPATATAIFAGTQLAMTAAGEVLFGGGRIRAIGRDGMVRTIAGGGTIPQGPPPSPRPALGMPADANGIAVAPSGTIFVTSYREIGRIDPDGIYTSLCCRDFGFGGDGGPAADALIDNSAHLALDSHGNLFLADTFNHRIRRIDAQTGIITTVAGVAPPHPPNVIVQNPSSGDGGPAASAQFNAPNFIAIDGNDRLYIADTNRIRRVDADGIIRVAVQDCSGPMTRALNGDILVYCGRLVRIFKSGGATNIATFGGHGFSGDGGRASDAKLGFVSGITTDSDGNVYLFDHENRRIRAVRGVAR